MSFGTKIKGIIGLLVFTFVKFSYARIDHFTLQDDQRGLIHLVSFGMYSGGTLEVNMSVLIKTDKTDKTDAIGKYAKTFGLTIDKIKQSSSQVAQYRETEAKRGSTCALSDGADKKTMVLRFMFDDDKRVMIFNKTSEMANICFTSYYEEVPSGSMIKDSDTNKTTPTIAPTTTPTTTTTSKTATKTTTKTTEEDKCKVSGGDTVATFNLPETDDQFRFNVSFLLRVKDKTAAGLYSIFFHNCAPQGKMQSVPVDMAANITGINANQRSYLSAGDIPEPYLFYAVCVGYVLLSFLWLWVLRKAKSGVYKTHYLMLAVCYCKALSALFHGTNYYYIGLEGKEETVWAVIYYISYLMKTVMLFLTIMLVGTGWTFIKHVFSDKEKKLFLVAIPLQLLVYISQVIISETDVATKSYSTWNTISIVVDLLCCVAILLPVIWSIRHLTEASQTDGKAALNLIKLRLFKTLYVLVISYIYITRIVILVFKFTLPYQYSWMEDFFREVTVISFLVMLGYKFRPADDNPYFQLPPDADDESEVVEMAVTQSGLSTDAKRRNLTLKVNSDDVEKQSLLNSGSNHGESSHELD